MHDRPIKTQLEATQQTVKFFETLLHSSVDGIVITDVMQHIIVVNEAFCSFFGKHPKDVIETSIFVWIDQLNVDAPDRWAKMEKQVRLKGFCRDTEFQLIKQSKTSHFSVNASLLEQVAEEEVGIIISVWRDITRQKQVEETLRESEEKYRLLVANADDAIFIVQDETVKFPNPKCEEMTGYAAKELAKMPFIDLIYPEDRDMVLDKHKRRVAGEELPTIYDFQIINLRVQSSILT